MSEAEAEVYHAQQIGVFQQTEVDLVTAITITNTSEAIGIVRAARASGLPVVISFTLETDGCLPTGQSLKEAINAVDAATDKATGLLHDQLCASDALRCSDRCERAVGHAAAGSPSECVPTQSRGTQ